MPQSPKQRSMLPGLPPQTDVLSDFFGMNTIGRTGTFAPGLTQDNPEQSAAILRSAPTASNRRNTIADDAIGRIESGDTSAYGPLDRLLRGEEAAQATDPWAKRYNDVGTAQSQAAIYNEPSVAGQRNDERLFAMQKEALGPTITGATDRDVASINAQGRLDAAMAGAGGGQSAISSAYADEHNRRSIDLVDEIISQVGRWTTGFGSLLDYIPGTAATNMASQLDSLKANIGFKELNEMRAASKTGGALGQVSDRETSLLQSVLGSLNSRQSSKAMNTQLVKIKNSLQRWRDAKGLAAPGAASMTDDSDWEDVNQ